jgi:TetR/AcrR family transcriptional repressor of nem operon
MGRKSNAKNRLLDASDSLFRDRGFSAVGVAELCSAAQVNKGSFYHYFRSKQALLLEVIDAAWDETGMLVVWENQVPNDPIDQLRQFLKELFAFHYADNESAGRVRGSLLSNLAHELGTHDTDISKKLGELLERETAAFESLLAKAIDRGDVSLENPRQAAESLIACVHGLLMLAKIRNNLSLLPQSENALLRLCGTINT